MRLRTMLFAFAPLAVACLLSGCGVAKVREAAARVERANDLKQLGLLYFDYNDLYSKAPTSAADLAKADASGTAGKSLQGLNAGQYVLLWGVKITDLAKTEGGVSGTVLGYEASVPTAGGNVLFADGSVRHLTAEEFQKVPKAKGT